MEKELYKNEIHMAVALLLCLWFKLDEHYGYCLPTTKGYGQ